MSVTCHQEAACSQPVTLTALETRDQGHSLAPGCSACAHRRSPAPSQLASGHQPGHPPAHSALGSQSASTVQGTATLPGPRCAQGLHGPGSPSPGTGPSVTSSKLTSRGLCSSLVPSGLTTPPWALKEQECQAHVRVTVVTKGTAPS